MLGKAKKAEMAIAAMAICGLLLAGCSGGSSRQLLESSNAGLGGASADLTLPSAEVIAPAAPSANGEVEETDLGADVPTLRQLSEEEIAGIDAPRVASALEKDQAAHKVDSRIRWRGSVSDASVDLTNTEGTLCSGLVSPGSRESSIIMACSDGNVAELSNFGGQSTPLMKIGSRVEDVELRNQ